VIEITVLSRTGYNTLTILRVWLAVLGIRLEYYGGPTCRQDTLTLSVCLSLRWLNVWKYASVGIMNDKMEEGCRVFGTYIPIKEEGE